MVASKIRKSVDLSHHVNAVSRSRHPSPLKDIARYMSVDGMVGLAGGLPHPSLFPFTSLDVTAFAPNTVLCPTSPEVVPMSSDQIHVSIHSQTPGRMNLTNALQYNYGAGDTNLRRWIAEFVKAVFQPAYDEWEILLNTGNTDGWSKLVRMLCEPGDFILCEEYTFPSAQAVWVPMGCKAVPIQMDGRGVDPVSLDGELSEWDSGRGRKPRILYLVPVGSNPAGSTMDGERRKEIYKICVRHDIIICEDDPYSFLQYAPFQQNQPAFDPVTSKTTTAHEFLSSLAPSFLHYDYEGRVIRLDTFSKTLAPGFRLGYFVANPMFSERLLRASEVETQAPSGWSSAIVSNLLASWGTNGYLQWLSQLRNQYRTRRDWICNAISAHFVLEPAKLHHQRKDADGLIAFSRGSPQVPLFTFVPPAAGMFVWAAFYFTSFPRFRQLQALETCEDPERTFQDELWVAMAKSLVLVTPGSYYAPWQGHDKVTTAARGVERGVGHFRLAFSMTTKEEMELGIERMAIVLKQFLC